MIKIRLDFERIILTVVFAILLFIGPGAVFDHRISHDFPFGYMASDAFQHQVRAESIKDAGSFKEEASYISMGFQDVVARYPPMIYHLSVLFSYAGGLETYDSIYFLILFLAIIGILMIYILFSNYNKSAALLALPLSFLAFTYPASIGFTWGHWPSIMGQFFLISFFLAILMIDIEKSYLIIAVLLAAIILTHTAEIVFAFIFLILVLAAKLWAGSLGLSRIKGLLIASFIALILTVHYLVIFKYTWVVAQPYTFFLMPIWEGNPGFYLANFSLLLVPIAAGIFFSLFRLKNLHIALIAALSMLLAGFMNYAGFEVRSFQIRFFWPVYLSIFFGLGVYMGLKMLVKKWNLSYTISLVLLFVIIIGGIVNIPGIPHYNKSSSEGLMNRNHWEAFKWLSSNTKSDSKIYFFYGDMYSQDAVLRNSKRFHYQVEPDNFVEALKNRTIKRYYTSELPGDSGGGVVRRLGLFKFEELTETKPRSYFYGPQDICAFNYLIFDKLSRVPLLSQYNLLIASSLLENKSIKRAFENDYVIILKNENPGDDCIEERSF